MSRSNPYKKNSQRSRLSSRLLFQYFFALAGYVGGILLLVVVAAELYSRFIWQGSDLVYQLAQLFQDYPYEILGVIFLVGWGVITYYFISRPLRYLDEVVEAAEQLVESTETPIELSNALRTTQDELNLVREQALRNALLAKEAEQRKNDLIVYLAHDLKTPLTSVIGYLMLLRDEPQISQELRAKYTGIALSKAERLEELINEFFDITRFSLSSLTLEEEQVHLSRMLQQITYEFNPVLAEKELQWELSIQPDVEFYCDPNKLERVFDNLIRNAVNYSYRDTKIRLVLEQTYQGVRILIKNHGKTIPAEKLDRIFEQFFRLDSSRATATGGAGLGLAIAKEIVELHGGTIKVESVNESITFFVTLYKDRKKIV